MRQILGALEYVVGRILWIVLSIVFRIVRPVRSLFAKPPEPIPSFADWLGMTDTERHAVMSRWNPYAGEALQLLEEITTDFRKRYGRLRGVVIDGPGVYHGGYWVIGIKTPFVFDRRQIPGSHLGITIHASLSGQLPKEFQDGVRTNAYIWAPEHYEQFVDRDAERIREELRVPEMSRDEMLAALVGRPFAEYVEAVKGA